jgi:hypothetical protein
VSTAEPAEPPANRTRTLAERVTDFNSRRAGVLGASFYAAATLAVALRGAGLIPDVAVFILCACWLIGAGCLGAPALVLRAFGPCLNPEVCLLVATTALGGAGCLTVAVACGWRIDAWVATFSLIILLAIGIQAFNAAYALVLERRAAEAGRAGGFDAGHQAGYGNGYDHGFLAGVAACLAEGNVRLESLARIEATLEANDDATTGLLRPGASRLHAVPDSAPPPAANGGHVRINGRGAGNFAG